MNGSILLRSTLLAVTLTGMTVGGSLACGGLENNEPAESVPTIVLPDPSKADSPAPLTQPSDCPGGEPLMPNGSPATWTMIHYSAGDNNLEDALVQDIIEMEAGHRGTSSVNVVVQLDRYSEPGVWRYHIRPDSDRSAIRSPLVGYSEQEPDSGDWRTLAAFGQWAVTCYPADYYVVIVSGHGTGWSANKEDLRSDTVMAQSQVDGEVARQIAPDDSHGSSMYISELQRALREIRSASKRAGDPDWMNRLALYGSDACLMATFEVSYELRNTATYLVGSEQTEPVDGWPYSTIIRDLTERPSYYAQRPHEFAKTIVHRYEASYGPWGGANRSQEVTLSAVDVSAMTRAKGAFAKATEALFELSEQDEGFDEAVLAARRQAYEFSAFVDMKMFWETVREVSLEAELIPKAGQVWNGDPRARDLAHSVDSLLTDIWPDLVLEVAGGPKYPQAGGLSIYFPKDLCGWNGGPEIGVYARSQLGKDTMWDDIVLRHIMKYEGDIPTYDGQGSVRLVGEGLPKVESLPVSCRFDRGQLALRGSDAESTFSATLLAKDGKLSISRISWSVLTESGTEWLVLPWREAPIDLHDSTFAPGAPCQVAGIQLPLESSDDVSGQTQQRPTLFDFSCADFVLQFCFE